METSGIVEGNVDKIRALFPHCITEIKGADGKLRYAVDFDKLRVELGDDTVERQRERYQFTWPQKSVASALANTPTRMTLRPDRDSSVDFDNTENLYIEGDNLEVLKVLRETYLGQVKMIYIDPPYNTGKDFVYKDRRYLSQTEMDEKEGKFDEYGNLLFTNSDSNGRFHTDWLNFIYPRLKVARDLLTDDGVIFISIDDNEVENLRKVCDEIFGEQNFEANISWRRRTNQPNDKSKMIAKVAENILVFAKNSQFLSESKAYNGVPLSAERIAGYSNPDNDPKGAWSTNPWKAATGRGGTKYSITTPTGKVYEETWYGNEETFKSLLTSNRVHWTDNGNGVPRIKIYLDDALREGQAAINFFTCDRFGSNQEGSAEMDALFEKKGIFDNPKPVRLIAALSNIATKEDSIILDFFSGSATTAHAVMKLNAEDGGNRKFIMVQLAEVTDENSEARKAGYENICKIGEERIRRAGKKIKEDAGDKAKDLDIGFRVLKLDTSNMKDVFYNPAAVSQLTIDDMIDNVKDGRGDEDLLFQVMLQNNIPLSARIEKISVNGHPAYVVDEGALIATFDRTLDDESLVELAKMEPMKFVMREPEERDGVNPDNLIDNFEQKFELYSPNTQRSIL